MVVKCHPRHQRPKLTVRLITVIRLKRRTWTIWKRWLELRAFQSSLSRKFEFSMLRYRNVVWAGESHRSALPLSSAR